MLNQSTTFTFGDSRLPVRFWAKVRLGSTPTHRPDLGPCWEWTGARHNKGYGIFWRQGRSHYAHRIAYEILVGPIPEGLESDHLCRNHACVNLLHIEPVTRSVNTLRGDHWQRRKTHCPQGHPYTPENTYLKPNGWRLCRACWRCRRERKS